MKNEKIKDILKKESYFILNKKIIKKIDLEPAYLFINFIEASDTISDEEGWFFQTYDIIEGLTGFKRKKQDKLIEELLKAQLILKKNKGIPRKRYFKINVDKLKSILFSVTESDKKVLSKRVNKTDDKGSNEIEENQIKEDENILYSDEKKEESFNEDFEENKNFHKEVLENKDINNLVETEENLHSKLLDQSQEEQIAREEEVKEKLIKNLLEYFSKEQSTKDKVEELSQTTELESTSKEQTIKVEKNKLEELEDFTQSNKLESTLKEQTIRVEKNKLEESEEFTQVTELENTPKEQTIKMEKNKLEESEEFTQTIELENTSKEQTIKVEKNKLEESEKTIKNLLDKPQEELIIKEKTDILEKDSESNLVETEEKKLNNILIINQEKENLIDLGNFSKENKIILQKDEKEQTIKEKKDKVDCTNCTDSCDKMSITDCTKCTNSNVPNVQRYKEINIKNLNKEINIKIDRGQNIFEEDKKEYSAKASSMDQEFKNNIFLLKEIIGNSTKVSMNVIENSIYNILPTLRKYDLKLLIQKIKESDFLMGKLEVKPKVSNFTRKNMIDRIMADEYKNKEYSCSQNEKRIDYGKEREDCQATERLYRFMGLI